MQSHHGDRRACGLGPPVVPATDGDATWTREDVVDVRAPLFVDGDATAVDAARIRHELAAWLAVDVPTEPLDDIVLAVYEAVANAAEHAYADRADDGGPVRVTAHRADRCVTVTVADDGRWQPRTHGGFGGRGLPVMRMLVQDLHVDRWEGGTTVYLRIALPGPAREA